MQILRRTLIVDYSSESAQSTVHTVQRIVHDMRQLSYDTVPGAVRSVAWIGCSHCIGSSGAIPPHIRQIIPAEAYVSQLKRRHVDYRIRAEYTAEYAVDHLVEFVRIEIHVYVAYACRRQIYVYARSQQSFYIQLSEHLCNTRDFFSRSLILRRRRRLSRRLFLSEIVRRVVDLLYKVFDRGSKHTENIQIKRKVGHEIRYVYRYETETDDFKITFAQINSCLSARVIQVEMKHCRLASAAVRVIFCFVDIVQRHKQSAFSDRSDSNSAVIQSHLPCDLLKLYSRVHIRFFAAVRCRTDRVGFQIESERKLETVEEVLDYLRAVHFCRCRVEHYELARIRGEQSVRLAVEAERKGDIRFAAETDVGFYQVSREIDAEACLKHEIDVKAERAEDLRHNVAGDVGNDLTVRDFYRGQQISDDVAASRGERFCVSSGGGLIFFCDVFGFLSEILAVEKIGEEIGYDYRIYTVERFVEFVEKYRDERRTFHLQVDQSYTAKSDVQVVAVAV